MNYLSAIPGGGYLAGDDGNVVLSSGAFLFSIRGQSNANGIGDATTLSDPSYATPYAPVTLVHRKSTGPTDPIVWVDYGPFSLRPYTGNSMGIELSLGRALDAIHPGKVIIAKDAINGSSLAGNWAVDSTFPLDPGPNLHSQDVTFITAQATTYNATIAADIWIQSETDAISAVWAAAYVVNMLALIDARRAVYGTIPFLFNRLIDESTATYTAEIRAAQATIATLRSYVTLIDSDALTTTDTLHFTADSYVALGLAFAAAYAAAINTTTIGVVFTDSADPVTTSGSYSYTLIVTNTGNTDAINVGAVITLPTGVTYTGSSGTGWTIVQAGQAVTCTRATLAPGAAPTITVTCTAPATFGAGSVSCTATVAASNLPTLVSDTEVTTLSLPAVTTDATSGKRIPQTDAEWTAALTTSTFAVPDSYWKCQEASGNAIDSGSAGINLVAAGTVSYEIVASGWSSKGLGLTDNTLGSFGSNSLSLPNPASASQLALFYIKLNGTPGANRDFYEACGGIWHARLNATPRIVAILSATTATGTTNQTGSVIPFVAKYDFTNSQTTMYTLVDKLDCVFAAKTGRGLYFGGLNVVPPACSLHFGAAWYGAKAEKTHAQIKALLEDLLWSPTFTP